MEHTDFAKAEQLAKDLLLDYKAMLLLTDGLRQGLKELADSFLDDGIDEVKDYIQKVTNNLCNTQEDLFFIAIQLQKYANLLKMAKQDHTVSFSINVPNLQEDPSFSPFCKDSVLAGFPRILSPHSIEDDLSATNPKFSHDNPDSPWNNNCQRCVCAYEARRRGYNVEALPLSSDYDPLLRVAAPDGWPYVFQNPKLIDCSANSGTAAKLNIEQQLEDWGDNARAIIRVKWKGPFGGGHVFIAERVNGVTRFIDPQDGDPDASTCFDYASGRHVLCMRIDNLAFSDAIRKCCQARR